MGVYSKKLKDLNNVPSGAKVAIPNDPTNGGRALALLQSAKLLKLRDGVGISGTPGDIVDNPKNLQIVEIEAALLRVPWMMLICLLSIPILLWKHS